MIPRYWKPKCVWLMQVKYSFKYHSLPKNCNIFRVLENSTEDLGLLLLSLQILWFPIGTKNTSQFCNGDQRRLSCSNYMYCRWVGIYEPYTHGLIWYVDDWFNRSAGSEHVWAFVEHAYSMRKEHSRIRGRWLTFLTIGQLVSSSVSKPNFASVCHIHSYI